MTTPLEFIKRNAFRKVLAPATVTLLYACLAWLLTPEGVNKAFSQLLLSAALLGLAAGLIVLLGELRKDTTTYAPTSHRPQAVDFFLLLLPLGPIVQYIILNSDILNGLEIVQLACLFAVATLLLVVVVPHLLSRWAARHLVFAAATATLFMLFNMAAMARTFNWHLQGEAWIQALVFAVTFLACAGLYQRDKKMLMLLSVGLFAATSLQALFIEQEKVTSVSTEAQQPIELVSVTPQATPDIFLLTYDSYVENETMLQYGIDNSPQESWLVENGFTLYPGTYSVAARSIPTMGRVFGGRGPITVLKEATAGDSPFFKQLKLAGYDSYGIFANDYFFQGVGGQYTYSFPPPASAAVSLAMAILEGEFRFNAHFDTPTQVEFETQKRAIMSRSGGPPKFLYTHTGPGHSQNSGACRANETDLFRQRLELANQEMKTDITTVLVHHPQAIVIVNGDHGPYLTKTCLAINDRDDVTALDIQDRFGAFLAIRWPDPGAHRPAENIRLLQDLAPALLSYIYPGQRFAAYRVADELATRRQRIAGVNVINGIITDGPDQGLPLFSGQQRSSK